MTIASQLPTLVSNSPSTGGAAVEAADRFRSVFLSLRNEIGRVFIGQTEVVDFVLYGLFTGGHVLIEGVPGLGKTLLVRTLADALSLPMSRIQFTPDLMPGDITGTNVLAESASGGHEIRFQPGPLISNLVLADEINRATPKTQSALLEAMQENQISVAGKTISLPSPFMVLATQNPVEQEGTYPLPEAQLDRFVVKLIVKYPTAAEMDAILEQTTGNAVKSASAFYSGQDVLDARHIVREVPASRQVRLFAINVVSATQPGSPTAPAMVKDYVAFGAGPRAAQALLLLAKARALLQGRYAVSCDDLRAVAVPVLRHRLVLNFAGLAARISSDAIVDAVIRSVPELSSGEG